MAIAISRSCIVHQINGLVPHLSSSNYKGQLGRVGVLGGCFEYTGAPFISAISSLRTGADLSFVFCSKDAATPIKSYGPEVIVIPSLRTQQESAEEKTPKEATEIINETLPWIRKLHALVVGPGLGRDEKIHKIARGLIVGAKESNIPLVIDADGIWAIENDPSLISGYNRAILTPNINEYKRLGLKVLGRNIEGENRFETVRELAKKLGNVTILSKGSTDIISDGTIVLECDQASSPRRCGGLGDVLAGTLGTFAAWTNREFTIKPLKDEPVMPAMVLAAYGGSCLTRDCARLSFESEHRSMVAFDLVSVIGKSFLDLFEHRSSL